MNVNGKFVAYYRVSTAKQGQSGLGLEAQKSAVEKYLNGGSWELVGEFVEVESGKRKNRPQLNAALALSKKQKATLIIAKLDRLARNLQFISGLMERGLNFSPSIIRRLPSQPNFSSKIRAWKSSRNPTITIRQGVTMKARPVTFHSSR